LSILQAFGRRVQGSAGLAFSIGGGLGPDGRDALPLQRTLSGDLSGSWKATAFDDLFVTLNGSGSASGTGTRSGAANLYAGWRTRFDSATTGSLSAGVGVIFNADLPSAQTAVATAVATDGVQVVPTCRISLSHSMPLPVGSLTISGSGFAQPGLDPLTGAGYLRGFARLDGSWTANSLFSLGAAIQGDRVLSGLLAGAFGAAGEVSASLRTGRVLSFRLAVRAALLTPTQALLPDEEPQHQWTVVAGVLAAL
jgi:hypothetical protein